MRNASENRGFARQNLKGNWGTAIGITLLFGICCFALGFLCVVPFVGIIAMSIIVTVFIFGQITFFVELMRGNNNGVDTLFGSFNKTLNTFFISFLTGLFTFLWSLLFLIPGIIKSYSYSMALYIYKDNNNLSATECITKSRQLMDGNKFRYFCLQLSFIGWYFLCMFTFGIGYIWLVPYIQASTAAFYCDIVGEKQEQEIIVEEQI